MGAADAGETGEVMSIKRRKYVDAIMNRCINFRGIQHTECEAHVNIRELVGGDDFGWASRLPCFLDEADKCSVVCESRSFPSRTDAEEMDRAQQAATERFITALKAAHDDARGKGLKVGHGGRESMPCPVGCGGTLHYTVASCNGHMHAGCTTKGCVSWME